MTPRLPNRRRTENLEKNKKTILPIQKGTVHALTPNKNRSQTLINVWYISLAFTKKCCQYVGKYTIHTLHPLTENVSCQFLGGEEPASWGVKVKPIYRYIRTEKKPASKFRTNEKKTPDPQVHPRGRGHCICT